MTVSTSIACHGHGQRLRVAAGHEDHPAARAHRSDLRRIPIMELARIAGMRNAMAIEVLGETLDVQ
jgi:hypothetical protein